MISKFNLAGKNPTKTGKLGPPRLGDGHQLFSASDKFDFGKLKQAMHNT